MQTDKRSCWVLGTFLRSMFPRFISLLDVSIHPNLIIIRQEERDIGLY